MVFAMLFVAPSHLIGLKPSPAITIVGLSMLGMACATVVIPIMPEMIDAIEDNLSVSDE